jgi:hypothetical protein
MDKLVRIRDSTYHELAKHGKWNDTMDSIIQRLLHQQQNNHGIDDTSKKSETEERQSKKMRIRNGSDEGKNVLRGALQVDRQEKRQALPDSLYAIDNTDHKVQEVPLADAV